MLKMFRLFNLAIHFESELKVRWYLGKAPKALASSSRDVQDQSRAQKLMNLN